MFNFIRYYLHDYSDSLLLISNIDYINDINYDYECISNNRFLHKRTIKIIDFIENKKKPLYYKYHLIIVDEEFIFLLNKLRYFFANEHFKLLIIIKNNYIIEKDDALMKIYNDKSFLIKIDDYKNYRVIVISR